MKEAFSEFEKPSVAVDTVILRVKDIAERDSKRLVPKMVQVLLVRKQGNKKWQLPGTIVRLGETSMDAIERKLGAGVIENGAFEQLYTVDNSIDRDERGHVISIVYLDMLKPDSDLEGLTLEGYEVQWFWVSRDRYFMNVESQELLDDLAYDHKSIISDAVDRIKGKLLYTDIGFNFVGETFTVRELEDTFEALNEYKIPGFRRLISDRIIGTGEMSRGNAFRPAEVYRKA